MDRIPDIMYCTTTEIIDNPFGNMYGMIWAIEKDMENIIAFLL